MGTPKKTLAASDLAALDRLIGRALMDSTFRARLLKKEDGVFLAEPGLSLSTWNWLKSLPAGSLQQFCQAILDQLSIHNSALNKYKVGWNDDTNLNH